MGGSTSSSADWSSYTRSAQTQSQSFRQAYTNQTGLEDEFDPAKIKVRESRNSDANPQSTPVILAIDSTSSMDHIALAVKKNIGTLMAELYDRKPITDPHVMAMFFDDVLVTRKGALQVTQFESDMVILKQMERLFWTSNGGGNGSESYSLPLHFAINHTECDAFAEGRRGFLFTVGDDGPPPPLRTEDLRVVYGPDYAATEPLSYEALLEQASENWDCFHLMAMQGSTMDKHKVSAWRELLGERAIVVEDITKIPEICVAIMQVLAGIDTKTVVDSFEPGTSLVVQSAIKGLQPSKRSGGVVRLTA